MSKIAQRLKQLNIVLPKFQGPVGPYRKSIREGNLVFTSTHFGMCDEGKTVPGKVTTADKIERDRALAKRDGYDLNFLTDEEAKPLARNAGLRLLSTLEAELGDLDKVEQVVKLVGFVNGVPDFTKHGAVISACSEVLVDVFGEAGKGARVCMGCGSLAAAITVDLVVRVKD
mmetsp:Transcript_9557/g.13922  ORF Transcript_9557/g.13922 Transcript_9557/m.13922 type:complete len:172 (+) Transcript_9557:45-560(+)|eukprot:CAMPEP_0175095420 /NCGR_PEP_ID=MMETSP0086_2-20121207/4144_1 /TAXON_ID=136419 /ORGANISM="Unknown Unknown, Strain D1" /LENGTH=171 /DNA_ID=CAMNT_0016368663 /DNA_START=40 /DNA_END=555 /DNA_ORIENTATION=-